VELITNSRLTMWETCPTKADFHYRQRLRPKGIQWALCIGRAVHTGMEALNRGLTTAAAVGTALEDFSFIEPYLDEQKGELEQYSLEVARIAVYVEAAAKFPRYPLVDVEVEFQVPLINPGTGSKSRTFFLAGKADGIVEIEGERYLLEYKTSGVSFDQFISNYGGNRQIALYTEALGVKGALIRYIGKTRKEPKRRGGETVETMADYTQRLLEEYSEDESKIVESIIIPTESQLSEFRQQVWDASQVMLFERRANILRKNYHECSDCPFHAVCHNETGWESLYYYSDTEHDELPGLQSPIAAQG
jgi:hypothetical protein